MRVATLLGINCGFYPGDTIAITIKHLHISEPIPYHDFRRAKTKRRRMAALWPETVEAITEYRGKHRHPLDSEEQRLVLAKGGKPYTRTQNGVALIRSFNLLANGNRVNGVSLGSLRHTYATVVDSVPDQTMIDLTMGHVGKGLQKRTYRQLNLDELERLQTVANVVRGWLFGAS